MQLQGVIPKWLDQLSKNPVLSGPSAAQRAALADEFYRLLHIYKQILEAQSPAGQPSMETARADVNVKWFAEAYKKKFGGALKTSSTETGLRALLDRQRMLSDKLELLRSCSRRVPLHGTPSEPSF